MMDDWARRRRAELEAAAPAERKRAAPFVKLPLAWASKAAAATDCQAAMVWIWLVHRAWQAKTQTVTVPNDALVKYGVTRNILRRLTAAGLIAMDPQPSGLTLTFASRV
jgi:hypothetical protein